MKKVSAILGIVFALGGTLSGLLNWCLAEFYLDRVGWEGPLVTLNSFTWLFNVLGVGLGVLLVGISTIISSPSPSLSDKTGKLPGWDADPS